MKLYKIKDWSEHFENNRSRQCEKLSWVPVPNSHDGENYSMLMTQDNAPELYTAWMLMLQVASKCHPRGSLLRGNRQPHDARSLALKTRARQEWFAAAFDYLIKNTDWLEVEDFAQERQETGTQLTPKTSGDRQATAQEGRNEGNELKERNARVGAAPLNVEIPAELQTKAFAEAWGEWIQERKDIKKPVTERAAKIQLKKLAAVGPDAAVQTIHNSIAGRWSGLFPEKHHANNNPNKPNPRNVGVAKCGESYGDAIARIVAEDKSTIEDPNLDL